MSYDSLSFLTADDPAGLLAKVRDFETIEIDKTNKERNKILEFWKTKSTNVDDKSFEKFTYAEFLEQQKERERDIEK